MFKTRFFILRSLYRYEVEAIRRQLLILTAWIPILCEKNLLYY